MKKSDTISRPEDQGQEIVLLEPSESWNHGEWATQMGLQSWMEAASATDMVL